MKDSNCELIKDGDTLYCSGTFYDVVSQDGTLYVHGDDYEVPLEWFLHDRITLSDLSVFKANPENCIRLYKGDV